MKMKLLSVLMAGAALTIVQAQADPVIYGLNIPDTDYLSPDNLIQNAGFEAPNTGKITTGFASVPFWNTGPTPGASDSGIDPYWAGNANGSWAGYSKGSDADNGVWANQTTGYVLQGSDSLYLSLVAGQVYSFGPGWSWLDYGVLHYQIWETADGGPGLGDITDGSFQCIMADWPNSSGNFLYYSAVIPNSVLAPYAGDTIGISIWNSTDTEGSGAGGPGSWIDFDDVYLGTADIITPTPEPGTIALLTLGGLSALVAMRRRRA